MKERESVSGGGQSNAQSPATLAKFENGLPINSTMIHKKDQECFFYN